MGSEDPSLTLRVSRTTHQPEARARDVFTTPKRQRGTFDRLGSTDSLKTKGPAQQTKRHRLLRARLFNGK